MDKYWIQMGYVDVGQFVVEWFLINKGLGLSYDISLPFDSKYSGMVSNTHQFGLFFNL
jgi:hypothetical protein